MLLAQLHRKIPHEFEGMEDVLTSSVFGPLKYLPDPMVGMLLSRFAGLPSPQGPIQIELWPCHPTPPGFQGGDEPGDEGDLRGDTEPDVVITAADWLVLMEVKYRSSFDLEYDQLGREFAIGYQLAQDRGRRFRLLVVTADTLEPAPAGQVLVAGIQNKLRDAASQLGDSAAGMITAVPDAVRWTSWQRIYCVLAETCEHHPPDNVLRLVEDICRLLELRGLKPYDGHPLVHALQRWEKSGISDEAWTLSYTYAIRLASSLAAGWKELEGLDLSLLNRVEWKLTLASHTYDPAACFGAFHLDSLVSLAWQPYGLLGGRI